MRRLVVGVLGHVDHGKTALVRALTGRDTDRLLEEKRRGISIALGFAHMASADAMIEIIDMPGHERFVRTMISGATGIDAAVLVVAANEGIKPQTQEHIDIASLLGVRRAIVAISKLDLVSSDQAQQIANDAIRLLRHAGIEPSPPIMTSAATAMGIDSLRRGLEDLVKRQQVCAGEGTAYLPIDRAFSIAGHGPVVTGTLRGSSIARGDLLEIIPLQREVRVRAVQVHGQQVEHGVPGQRVAVNLRDIDSAELRRGMALAAPGSLAASQWLSIAVRAVDTAPPLKNAITLRALVGTDEFDARLRLLDRDVLERGEHCVAQLHCAKPIAVPTNEHVILRLLSPPRTVAGGKVLECATRRARRNDPSVLHRLEELWRSTPVEIIAAEVRRRDREGTTLRALSLLTALAKPRIAQWLKSQPVVCTQAELVIWRPALDALIARIPTLLAPHPNGWSQRKLLDALPGVSNAVLDEALVQLLTRGVISERNAKYLLARPDEDRARAAQASALAAQLAETLRSAGLAPPSPKDIVTSPETKRAVDRLLRERIIVLAVDRAKRKELLFHRDAIETAKRKLEPLLQREPGLLVSEIATALGISRKYCMPLLDHLDAIRFTRRVQDRRVLGHSQN